MQLEINSRHFTLGDDMREKIVEKLENLKRYSPSDPLAARLTLTLEGGRFTGDLSLNLKQYSCHTKVQHVEPDGAAFLAIESVERQVRRHKDRVKDHRGHGEEGGLGEALADPGLLNNRGSALSQEGFQLRDLTVDQAREAFAAAGSPFFVFRDAESGEVAVLYRRDDGGYGLMRQE
ncbi:MAG: HPF/RaiA family ribosome-associated protein [bacterium]|nr:HPF/RaiA family ribosome-associated protein [bacterium]